LNIRVPTLVWACALSLIALEGLSTLGVAAQTTPSGAAGAPSGAAAFGDIAGGPVKRAAVLLHASEQDPAARSAKSIECAQKADARGLIGKQRKRFLHACKSGA
jgi:hypothetical protein